MSRRTASAAASRARRPPPRGAAGFTLIELLLVLAIMAVVGALFLGAASTLMRAEQPRPADLFWRAIDAAREAAVRSGRPAQMRVDPESGDLLVLAGGTSQRVTIPATRVSFLSVAARSSILLGGQLVETATRPVVVFYPEGTCDPFRALLLEPGGRRTVLEIDPWTCAPVLPAATP